MIMFLERYLASVARLYSTNRAILSLPLQRIFSSLSMEHPDLPSSIYE